MSEEPKNENQPPKPSNENGFNWRSFTLIAIALGLFSVLLFVNNKDEKAITFYEFKEYLRSNRIVLDEKSNLPFEIVEESPFSPTIKGYYVGEPLNAWEDGTVKFKFDFDQGFQGDVIRPIGESVSVGEFSELKSDAAKSISAERFKELVRSNAIVLDNGTLTGASENGRGVLVGEYRLVKPISGEKRTAILEDVKKFKVSVNAVAQANELNQLIEDYSIPNRPQKNTMSALLMSMIIPLLLIAFLIFFFRQQMKMSGKGPMSFGKSKARMLSMDKNKVTFKNVAGIQEAKEELYEIVDYLKDPKKFQMLGATIPKGVLMVGPPGTGKTLLARAIAGEADVPFFSISGSDFVEMFVGVGASRVRDMFEQGKKHSPCLIFIDEIDAVGRHRGHGHGGGNDEREQTLNALLVEMDGFDAQEGIIIIAATNRPDVLDPALLRPGRFDRQVRVALPDYVGREEILEVHAKKIKISENVDLGVVARGTPGFSGAELANLINEAALLAARKGLKSVSLAELEEARVKVRWGRERRSLALSDKEKNNTAYHEAGHVILNILCEHTDPLHKVTIIPRGPALGMAMFLPEEDRFSYRLKELEDQLVVTMGGRVAEEIVFGNYTNGAAGDIRQATSMARQMVCNWGMSPKLGMVEYGESGGDSFLGVGESSANYSSATAQIIDEEIKRFIDESYQRATEMLVANRGKLDLIANALVEFETLDGEQITDLLHTGEMKNPPSSPQPPELPESSSETPPSSQTDLSEESNDGVDGEVVGAPA